jgi:hypothetical protein
MKMIRHEAVSVQGKWKFIAGLWGVKVSGTELKARV